MSISIRINRIIIAVFAFILLIPNLSWAQVGIADKQAKELIIVTMPSCPYCLQAKQFLNTLQQEGEIDFSWQEYDISESVTEIKKLYDQYQVPQTERGLMPTIFLVDNYYLGFNSDIAYNIKQSLKIDTRDQVTSSPEGENLIKLPFLGEKNISKYSLPILTIIFGIVDGFNVCSLGALVIVLGLVSVLRSRKRIITLGGVFLLTTAIVYVLLILIWHQLFTFIAPHIRSLEILIGIIAIAGGIYLLKEFIQAYKSGPVCTTNNLISRLSKKTEKVFQNKTNILLLLGAVVAFAGVVTIIEFPCSAALPVLFAGILVESGLSLGASLVYMALYMLFYLLDEIIIFLIAIFTLRIKIVSSRFIIFFNLLAALIFLFLGFYYLL